MQLTAGELLLAVLGLLEAVEESGDDLRQIRRKFLLEETGHDAEEHEAALLQPRASQLDARECLCHHIREVRAERLLADSFAESSDSIHSDSTELLLLTLASKREELNEVLHRGLEVRHEVGRRCVGCAADGTDDDGLHGEGSRQQETAQVLHDHIKILADVLAQDLKDGIQRSTSCALSRGGLDELHDRLVFKGEYTRVRLERSEDVQERASGACRRTLPQATRKGS